MMPVSVLGFYGAVLVWAVLIARGFSSPRRWPAIAVFGLVLLLFVITGPLLREWESSSLLISIWASAPLGSVIADGLRRHWDRQVATPGRLATQ